MAELDGEFVPRITRAITELSKGMKAVSFYPEGHPTLIQLVSRIISLFEEIPLPEMGLEIEVTKSALTFNENSLPVLNKSVVDMNRELYIRRASKVIFLPGLKPGEIVTFLKILCIDIREIQDKGGLERLLLHEKISRIWVNRVDYEGLTEMLKKEKEEIPPEGGNVQTADDESSLLQNVHPEELTIEDLLTLIEKENDPGEYRDYLIAVAKALYYERMDRKIEYASRALKIFARHIEFPPMQNEEIANLARLGIKEMAFDELVSHYIHLLRDRGGRGNKEVETILVAFGDRSVKPLLKGLGEEDDILVRKSIVDIITRIGRTAVPAIIENLSDSRWFVVRNMVKILGNMGFPDLAPHVATVLTHPDLRVKKEAIKALARLPHPSSIIALGDLCFFPEETIALTATGAMAAKKEPEAVLALYRRVVHRQFLFPHYRLAHEAIDSLRVIGTDEALSALEDILRTAAVWQTKNFRAMKKHALRSISKITGERAREALENVRQRGEVYLRTEAERLLGIK